MIYASLSVNHISDNCYRSFICMRKHAKYFSGFDSEQRNWITLRFSTINPTFFVDYPFFSSKCNQSICFLSHLGIRATVQKIINLSLLIPRVRTNLHFPTNWHSDGAQISTANEDRIFRCCLPFAQIDRGLEIFTASSLLFRKSFVYKEVKHSRTIQFPVFINTSNL